MKILLVTPIVPQKHGAGAIPILLHAQLEGLRRHHRVTLVTAVGDEPGEARAVAELRDSGIDISTADRRQPKTAWARWRRRLRMAWAWTARRRPWRAIWFADPAVQDEIDRLAARDSFDVAVVEDSAMAFFRLPDGIPSVLTEHEVLRPRPVDWRPGPPWAWPAWALRELDWRRRPRFQRAAWRRFDRVLSFSRRDAAAIAELAPEVADRVRVSPFGLDLQAPADRRREEQGRLLFVGNFTHQPNRDAASWLTREIMPTLSEVNGEARLVIVGSSPPREVLALAGPRVEVVADAPSIEPHLAAAAVVVAPVRTGGGMRMKVLEAMAAGKAVVTSDRGAEGFDCFDAPPPLTIADDADAFASQLAELLEDGERRLRLGEQARAFTERHYTPAAWAARLTRLYEEAIGDPGATGG